MSAVDAHSQALNAKPAMPENNVHRSGGYRYFV